MFLHTPLLNKLLFCFCTLAYIDCHKIILPFHYFSVFLHRAWSALAGNNSTANIVAMSVDLRTGSYGQVHHVAKKRWRGVSISDRRQTNFLDRFIAVAFCRQRDRLTSTNTKYQPVFRQIGSCLVGREMRKILALATLLAALYGYLMVMDTALMAHLQQGVIRKPSRSDRYITYDGRELPLCPAYPHGLRE